MVLLLFILSFTDKNKCGTPAFKNVGKCKPIPGPEDNKTIVLFHKKLEAFFIVSWRNILKTEFSG